MTENPVVGQMSIAEQMSGCQLGDRRLEKRLVKIQARLEENPASSFPASLVTGKELEGFYRFIENPKVKAPKILAAHQDYVRQKASNQQRTLIIHDTTRCGVPRTEQSAKDLYRLSKGKYGFDLHVSLATSADSHRQVLGIADLEFFDPNKKAAGRNDKERYRNPENIHWRWMRQILSTDQAFKQSGCHPIHVADRAADSFDHLAAYDEAEVDYIIRARFRHRRLNWPSDDRSSDRSSTLDEGWSQQPVRARRLIEVSSRKHPNGGPPKNVRTYPERDAREATVEIRARRLPLARSTQHGLISRLPRLWVNVVHVWEPEPPSETDRVDWLLLTLLPIETVEDVTNIVDHYRDRWTVEEFNKALKTGCQFQSRQLESLHTFQNVTAMLAPIACQLLDLRSLSRRMPDTPALDCVSDQLREAVELRCKIEGITLPDSPSVAQFYQAIADLGGHIRNNGPVGWQVLWRGMKRVIETRKVLDAVQRCRNRDVINL